MGIKELKEITNFGESKIRQLIKELTEKGLLLISKQGNKNTYELDLDKLDELYNQSKIDSL